MTKTAMRQEIEEIPEVVERLLTVSEASIDTAAAQLQEVDPAFLVTVARGSSDHACTYLKYASELLLGLPVASVGPSVASIYGAPLKVDGAACLAISQSGQSPDIVRMTDAIGQAGAMTLAMTNSVGSRLADVADVTIDIAAGEERSVAATKTFIASAVAGLLLLAKVREDQAVIDAIHRLPHHLDAAAKSDWGPLAERLSTMRETASLFTLGRGPSWAIANEAALKFKEVCQLHAESYSSAEVLHGPVSIVDRGFPVLAFAAADAAEAGLVDVADQLTNKGASVFVTSGVGTQATSLPVQRTDHPLTDPLSLIVSFYAMIEGLAGDLGLNPDVPRHLKKVTETH